LSASTDRDLRSVFPNRLPLFRSPAAIMVCRWSEDPVGGRCLMYESGLLRYLKGPFRQRDRALLGEPIEWVDTTRYQVVTLDKGLTWSPHIDQVRKKTAQRMGMLGPLLNSKSDLSVRKGVLLYKHIFFINKFIFSMLHYN